MSVLNFPPSPSTGDLYAFGDYTYRYDGEKWTTISLGNVATLRADLANPDKGALLVRGAVIYANTIADLRALEPVVDGQQVELLGHTVAGIGGGTFYADFSSSAADDNGVTVVTPGLRRWIRRLDFFVNPDMFGALGDGVTDDTQAVQSAINTIPFAGSGGVCLSPGKIYNISASLTFFNKRVIFDGSNSSINLTVNANYILDVESTSCVFKNVKLRKVAGVVSDGMRLKGTRFVVDNISASNPKFGRVFYLDECKESFFRNIRVDNDVSGLTGKIFYLHGAVNNTLSDSMIGYCDNAVYSDSYKSSEGFTVANVITVMTNVAFKMTKITSLNITNSVLDFCTDRAVEVSSGQSLFINNTWCALVEGSTGAILVLGPDFSGVKVYNNYFVGNGASTTGSGISSNAKYVDLSYNSLVNLNFGVMNGATSSATFNKKTGGSDNLGNSSELKLNGGVLELDSISLKSNSYSLGKFSEFSNKKVGGGSDLVYSNLGDVPTFGEVYVYENGTNNYLSLSFFKRGRAYPPTVTTVASNGLTFSSTNANGTINITGFTDIANCVFSAKYRAVK